MPNPNRLWDLQERTVRRQRRLKTALDFAILAAAILTLAVVFGSQPVIGL